MRYFILVLTAFPFCFNTAADAQLPSGWKAHDLSRPQAPIVTPGECAGDAPGDAVVLFDGSDISKWRSDDGSNAKWRIVDGAMESVPNSGYVFSREEFGDCQVHVEFASPKKVTGNGQGRGNSGVYLMGEFEVQVLDSFENPTYVDGSAGSIYGQYPPLVNASRKPGEWQSYDIIFRRPRFNESGTVDQPARVTVLHNGVLVQDASEAFGPTNWIVPKTYASMAGKTKGPLALQDHGNPVRYRNIWVRPLVESRPVPQEPYDSKTFVIDEAAASLLVGDYNGHRIAMEDGNLIFRFHGQFPLELVPHSSTEFGFAKSAGTLTIEVDDKGKGKAIEIKLDATRPQKATRKE